MYYLNSILLASFILFCSGCKDLLDFKEELCDGSQCFNITTFGGNLESRLGSTTLGYSYAIYYDGTLQKWGQNGQARRSQDGNAFDVNAINTDMNVGSCAKSITSIATLQVLKKNNLPVTTLIVDYLPTWWIAGSNVNMITFEDLLRHTSGFRPSSDAVTYTQIKDGIASGISTNNYGQGNYQNMNFCLLRILIPILDGTFDRTNEITDQIADNQTIEQFWNYLDTEIFNPLNIEASCNNEHDIMYYSFSNPNGNGFEPDYECERLGGGTISMSASDLCRIMYFAQFESDLLSSDMQSLMFSTNRPLGCYSNNVNASENWGGQFHHNGGVGFGQNRGAEACWYSFHNDVVVAVSTNSAGGITSNGYMDINDLIEQAFDDAWTP